MLTRRAAAQLLAAAAVAAALGGASARAADKAVKVGLDLSLTGADAESAARIKNGALMAFEEINAKHDIQRLPVSTTRRRRRPTRARWYPTRMWWQRSAR
jgi:ABC-type branched-subunit amino acid transport system substrate-binding protein